jgi:hypothetical protein
MLQADLVVADGDLRRARRLLRHAGLTVLPDVVPAELVQVGRRDNGYGDGHV